VERHVEGNNRFGLHGNALLSRYPIGDIRAIPLDNGVDKIAHREKRLGRQAGNRLGGEDVRVGVGPRAKVQSPHPFKVKIFGGTEYDSHRRTLAEGHA